MIRMARENPRWGYTRIRGALYNVDHEVGRNTIKRILLDNGFDPRRKKGMSWKTFLMAHWSATAATDFFSVEVIIRSCLVRYFVLFVIDLKTRRIEIAGILPRPDDVWMRQIARNLTDAEDGFLNGSHYLVYDRDPLFTRKFSKTLAFAGVKTVRLPARIPNLNAYAERFVRSIKSERLAQIIPLGEEHLRDAVQEYTEHYHVERNHQGLDNLLIEERHGVVDVNSAVVRHERLGGVLNYYERRSS